MPSESAVQQVWTISLIIYAVVLVVVAVLLTLVLRAARSIHGGVRDIWNVGQKVANNTIQIALLMRTNHLLDGILESAGRTASAVSAVERHARSCPHCPDCAAPAGARGALP